MESIHNFFNGLAVAIGIALILIIALALFCMILGAVEMVTNPQVATQAAQEYPAVEQQVNSAQNLIQVDKPGGT